MAYSFDKVIERRGSGCVKWDLDPDLLPMWVADMDFEAPEFIKDALRRRLDHGIFGYTQILDDYYEAVIRWFKARRGWEILREWIIPAPGVIPAMAAVVRAFTQPGDKVLVNSPAYNHFFAAISNNGCKVASSPLLYQVDGDLLRYEIDYEDLDR
ncbi:MAG: aminotransferase class I/II-fold pyridoxal phosphate-dependent enzyme, partial [Bacteroidales bacterium]|nr:aminotransferase class I/II-fold pyridoxal phosphate-dependent enzyme [Bacteroidales bacterium]